MNSNMRIAHTKEVRLFFEGTGVEQALVKNNFTTFEEAYPAYIRNCTTYSINNTVDDILAHLQENYRHLIPRELPEREDIINKMNCHPREPIMTIFFAVKEIIGFSDITRTSHMQHQAINIAYVIIHSMGNFALAIRKWNHMPKI